jgi:hypothetical protein
MQPEYKFDYSKGIRGKYHGRLKKKTNVVLLDPDVAKAFPNSASVNKALRSILKGKAKPARPARSARAGRRRAALPRARAGARRRS